MGRSDKAVSIMILVTGATGFLGNHVARALVAEGETVRVLVRASSNLKLLEDLPGLERAAGDLKDRASLLRATKGCSRLFHVAADYRFDVADPEETYRTNVEGTKHLMEAAAEAGVARIVYTSTVGCIGLPASGALGTEETPVALKDMVGTYKRTKFQAEQVVLELAAKGLPAVIVNPTAPIGERDVRPTPTGEMILRFLRRKMPAVIDTGLNLIDVRDCAKGHLLACERGRTGQRYILGCKNLPLVEIARTLARITGLPAPKVELPYAVAWLAGWLDTTISLRRGKTPSISFEAVRMARKRMFVDAAKAVRELALPQAPPEEPLARAVEWFRANGYV